MKRCRGCHHRIWPYPLQSSGGWGPVNRPELGTWYHMKCLRRRYERGL